MCEMVRTSNGIEVAAIKKACIENIISNASDCKNLDRIVLFGSSISSHCEDDSDIDMAVFSDVPHARFLSSKSFREFMQKIYMFDADQTYDVLYFKTGKEYKEPIFSEVMKGKTIYG